MREKRETTDTNSAILERLDALIQLLLPSTTGYALPEKGDRFAVLSLCDYEHSREEIKKLLGKSQNRVDVVLNSLRKDGLVKSVSKNGTTLYVRVR